MSKPRWMQLIQTHWDAIGVIMEKENLATIFIMRDKGKEVGEADAVIATYPQSIKLAIETTEVALDMMRKQLG